LSASLGCVQLAPGGLPRLIPWLTEEPRSNALTQEELREDILFYLGSFSAIVAGAADTIAEQETDPTVRKRTLFWKLHLIPHARDAALLDDPREAYAALVGVAVAQRLYLTEGDGREVFGEHQPVAVVASQRAEAELMELGSDFLTDEELERLRSDTVAFMRRRPISGRDFSVASIATTRSEAKGTGMLDWITQVPLSPFRALEGVGEGGAAIREFNDTAIRFAAVVEGLPEQVRWQSELLLFDAESREATQRALAAGDALVATADRLTAAFETLPKDVAILLEDSRGAVALANAALQNAQALLEPLRAVASELSAAGEVWERVIRPHREGDAPPGRPFDIREWESALQQTSAAAGELRSLATELQVLAASDAVANTGGLVGDSVALVENRARDVVDHAAWRAAQLFVGLFGLLVAYRVLVWRLGGRGLFRERAGS
jgi:hypothetical protein